MASFKITKKPLSIILSVLIFIMSIIAAGVFSISADAATTSTTNCGIVGHVVGNGNWSNTTRFFEYNSAKARYEIVIESNDLTNVGSSSQFRFRSKDVEYIGNRVNCICETKVNSGVNPQKTAEQPWTLSETLDDNLDGKKINKLTIYTKQQTFEMGQYDTPGEIKFGVEIEFENPKNYTLEVNGVSTAWTKGSDGTYTTTDAVTGLKKVGNTFKVTETTENEVITETHNAPRWNTSAKIKFDPNETANNRISLVDETYQTYSITSDAPFVGNVKSLTYNAGSSSENNDVYEITFKAEDVRNGKYWYKIAEGGTSTGTKPVDAEVITVNHDYGDDIKFTCTVTGLSTFSGNVEQTDSKLKYTVETPSLSDKELQLTTASEGAGQDGKRYELVIDGWQDSMGKQFSAQASANGMTAKPFTASINDENIKNGATVTIYYDESRHNLAVTYENLTIRKYGDLNQDGKYNVIDAYMIRKIAEDENSADSLQKALADVDKNGSVTIDDVKTLNEYIVGNIAKGGDNQIGDDYTPTP